MTRLFSAPTRLEAWLGATEHLLQADTDLNVILDIAGPGSDGAIADSARERIDEFFATAGEMPLHTVAETIFPGWQYSRRGLRGLFESYETEYTKLKKGDPGRWGTYAYRMIRRNGAEGKIVNPLKTLIEKMQGELKNGAGAKKACYELGIAEGEYDLPLYNTVRDQNRRRGLPCLSHLSFKVYDKALHLTAIYRSHDYAYKVLGNLLGLARLQACVAGEVGLPIGTLVVHSTYAWYESSKGPLQKLVNDLKDMVNEKVPA
jgi:hypothetical protein